MATSISISKERLLTRLSDLAEVGAIDGGGVCRLALTDADKAGRDQVCQWMTELGLEIVRDAFGNVRARYLGRDPELSPVMMGSHIDTVRTGGRLDGNLGVLAGLEIIEACQATGIRPLRSLEVAFFTNEEGSRFSPDMMGSLVYTGELSLEEGRSRSDADGITVGQELDRLGLVGPAPVPGPAPYAFLELHIEQGPVLEKMGLSIGVVTAVQGISWQKLRLHGQSNHAGTTPRGMRKDAGLAASRIHVAMNEIVEKLGGDMVGTVGHQVWRPNLINVIPNEVEMTVDLRSPREAQLGEAESLFDQACREICEDCAVGFTSEQLVRLAPFAFDSTIVSQIESGARRLGLPFKTMVSGAGHDAQILGQIAPAGVIFVPSIGGISHNVVEATAPDDLLAGCQLLADTVLALAETP